MRFVLAWTFQCCVALAFSGDARAIHVEPATVATASTADISAPLRDKDLLSYFTKIQEEKSDGDIKVQGYQPLGGVTPDGKPDDVIDFGPQAGIGDADLDDSIFVFEGLGSDDNADLYGFSVAPPDPVGDVGKNYYVQMVNLAFAVYDKNNGNIIMGPLSLEALWDGFPITDCAEINGGDPIVVYDQFEDRWLLTAFSIGCLVEYGRPCYNCLAISETDDPTGRYYRHAFQSQLNPYLPPGTAVLPDYPKWGVWGDSYILTTRDFYFASDGSTEFFALSVYAINKAVVLEGQMDAPFMHFTIGDCVAFKLGCPKGVKHVPFSFFTNGLLPPDVDGHNPPPQGAPAPLFSTTDDEVDFAETGDWIDFDAVNMWELSIDWYAGTGSLDFAAQLAAADFSSFPGRRAVPQPGVTEENYIDASSQFGMYRQAYRNEGKYESMLFCQSVLVPVEPPQPRRFGVRWYEIRREEGVYEIYQQGTYSPNDETSRFMGSIAEDGNGGIALGFSVSNGIDVFPGIRVTGRLEGGELGKMTVSEATIVNGGGAQINSLNRFGDYSSMNIDSEDDCTFWYTNGYIPARGERNWKTKIASFKLPGCKTSKGSKTKGSNSLKTNVSERSKTKGSKSLKRKIVRDLKRGVARAP